MKNLNIFDDLTSFDLKIMKEIYIKKSLKKVSKYSVLEYTKYKYIIFNLIYLHSRKL